MFASAVSDPTVASQDAMVPLSLDPAPTLSTAPEKAGTGLRDVDTPTTTTPSGPADVLDTVAPQGATTCQ